MLETVIESESKQPVNSIVRETVIVFFRSDRKKKNTAFHPKLCEQTKKRNLIYEVAAQINTFFLYILRKIRREFKGKKNCSCIPSHYNDNTHP